MNYYRYHGLYMYQWLPDGMRLATLNDFILTGGYIREELDFLVACWNTPDFEAHKSGQDTLEKWGGHIKAGRVYVRPDNYIPKEPKTMFLNDNDKLSLQLGTLPEGYSLVKSGQIMVGDIRWNPYRDEWNLSDPVCSPRHDIIIGDQVKDCHGICRKMPAELAENPIFQAHQAITC